MVRLSLNRMLEGLIDFLIPHNINPGEIQDYSTKSLVLSALKYCTEFEPLFLGASVGTYVDKLELNRCL